MSDERLREALEAVLPWVDCYEDHMSGEDFDRREGAELFARRVLIGDTETTLDGAVEEIREHRRKAAAAGPKIVVARSPR